MPTAVSGSAQSTAFTAATSDSANDNQKSFADCLKETHDHPDKEDQTAEMPRPHSSPIAAGTSKETSPKKTAKAATSPLVTVSTNQPQVVDARSLLLSLDTNKTTATDPKADAAATAEVGAAVSAGPTLTSNMAGSLAKGAVAFGVSMPKQAIAAGLHAPTQAVAPVPGGVQDGKHFSQGQGRNSGKDDNDGAKEAGIVAAPAKDVTQTAAASTAHAIASQSAGATAPQPVARAYTESSAATATQSSAPTAPMASAAAVIDASATPSIRPQSIEIRVPGTGGADAVDVRVSQRAGDVEVTVRTPDNELAQSLRQHLPELSDRLNQSGVAAEIWQPAATAGTSNGNNSGSHEQPGSEHPGYSGQHQPQHSPQSHPDGDGRQNRPTWIDSFYAEQESR